MSPVYSQFNEGYNYYWYEKQKHVLDN